MAIALAAFLVAATVGLFAIWRSQARDPEGWRRRLHENRWRNAFAWTACMTAAVTVGALLGGAGELAAAAVACGAAVLVVLGILWSYARTFGG